MKVPTKIILSYFSVGWIRLGTCKLVTYRGPIRQDLFWSRSGRHEWGVAVA